MVHQKITSWKQELDSEAIEEYDDLHISLQRIEGVGLFFVECSPATGENIISEIKKDIIQKRIEVLRLTKPIASLYNIIIELPNLANIDILFISGLEHSLYEYEQYTFNNSERETYLNSKERYSQSWRGVPRFLGYLNLQRDRFREDFDISFVFLLPSFGIDYFIKRAPDFFDCRSGLFRFIPRKDHLISIDLNRIFQTNIEQSLHELLELKSLDRDLDFSKNERIKLIFKQLFLSINCQRYEDVIHYTDCLLKFNQDNYLAWYLRAGVLGILRRLEEAVISFDKALKLKSDDHEAWYFRGYVLIMLDRVEEAIASLNKALELKPNDHEAWYLHGLALGFLGRLEEAIISHKKAIEFESNYYESWYSLGLLLSQQKKLEEAIFSFGKALEFKPNDHEVWYMYGVNLLCLGRANEAIASFDKALELQDTDDSYWYFRGVALGCLGRLEEAIKSYNKSLELNPKNDLAWYNLAWVFALTNQIQSAIESLEKAILINNKYKEIAQTDSKFNSIRQNSQFQSLINSAK